MANEDITYNPGIMHRRFLAAFASLTLLSGPANASTASYLDAWRWVHFTTASGLPSDFVTTVVDVPGSGAWALTRGGAARFDGFRWRAVPQPKGVDGPPTSLVADGKGGVVAVAGGRLLVGGASGLRAVPVSAGGRSIEFAACVRAAQGVFLLLGNDDRIYQWDGQTCRLHTASQGLGRVRSIRQAREFGVWALADRGLSSWDGAGWTLRLPGRNLAMTSVAEPLDGRAIAYVDAPAAFRGLWQWSGGSAPLQARRQLNEPPIDSVAVAPDGDTVAVYYIGEVVRRTGADWAPLPQEGVRILDARSVGFLVDGDLWVASDHGLYVHRNSSTLWQVMAIPRPDERNSVNEIVPLPDGQLFLATARGIVEASLAGGMRPDPLRRSDDIGAVTGLALDRRGRLWATSGYSFTGARWRDRAGRWHKEHLGPELDGALIHKVVIDREGGVWFLCLPGDPGGLRAGRTGGPGAFRLSVPATGGPERVDRWGPEQGLPAGPVYGFAEGPDRAYWFATRAGISRWRAGTWKHWTVADGLKSNRVFALAVDRRGVVWFGHQDSFGVGRLDHDMIRYFTTEDGLATDAIWSVHIDDGDRPWAVGEGGVSVLQPDGWTAFDSRSGLTSTRFWSVVSVGDRLCLGSLGGGLVILNLAERTTPPPVVVADAPVVDEATALVRWRAYAWWGEIAPDAVLTRTRLDGGPWTKWSTEREHRFSGIQPGSHTVAFQSKGLLGTVNGGVPRVGFSVPPPLVRDPVFYVPMASFAVIIVGLSTILITRQRRHQRDLRQHEQQIARTFQASPLAAAITRLEDGRFLDVNRAMVTLSGQAREDLIGRTGFESGFLLDNGYRAGLIDALRSGQPVPPFEMRAQRRSGDPLDLVMYVEGIEFGGAKAMLSQMLDVTDERRLESQLRQAQKMESIGRLAGGVAHDFNNLLTVILGNAELVRSNLPEGDPRQTEIEQIKIASQRAERLTRQLLTFARKQVVERKVVDMNDVVLATDRMLRRLIGTDIELVTLPSPDVESVLIDPSQLDQVLVNMAVNARAAMPSGGTLTIRTQKVTISDREAQKHPEASAGTFMRLSITDTGIGMDRATQERLFEPFFTTKGPDKGTGLGLATCYGIVKQAGGHILLESDPGRGTTFHVDLPPAPASTPVAEARDRPAETKGGGETILLAEDEFQVRRLAVSILRRQGYTVVEAASGTEALQVADDFPGRIDILVTDIVMPHMRGTELAQRICAARPDLKVLFMSGYTDDDLFCQEAGTERPAFLAKPFTPTALACKVRDTLDAPIGGPRSAG
jgi:PAS domain S-box-containing protein